jgi:hypothetical protein
MSNKDKLTEAVTKRKAVLAKMAASDGKATPEQLRTTRKQLKRAQRSLATLAKNSPAPKEEAKPETGA